MVKEMPKNDKAAKAFSQAASWGVVKSGADFTVVYNNQKQPNNGLGK